MYLSVCMYLYVSVFMHTYLYVSVSIMHVSACIAYIVPPGPPQHGNCRHVLKTPPRGAAPGGLHSGHPRACVQTLYFAISVPRGDLILCTPSRRTRLRLIPLKKCPSDSAGAAPMTDPRTSIRSHAQSQPIWRVGFAPDARERPPPPLETPSRP
jgi:hypothetical protein